MSQFSCKWNRMSNSSIRIDYLSKKMMFYNSMLGDIANDLPFSANVKYEIKKAINKKQSKMMYHADKIGHMSSALNEAADLYKSTETSLYNAVRPAKSIFLEFIKFGTGLLPISINSLSSIRNMSGILNESGVISASVTANGTIGGVATNVLLNGKISSLDTDLKTKYGIKVDDSGNVTYLGAEVDASATYALASGEVAGSIGLLKGSIKGSVGNAGVQGTAGASLYKDGKLSPSIYAKASAKVSALEGSVSTSFGTDDENVFVKANGEVLSAKAYAEGSAGVITTTDENGVVNKSYGVQGKAGAEAYVAQGSVSGGFTVFGVKISGTVTGKAGGAGVSAGGSATTSGVSGEIGAGLGLGIGFKLNVDWSGFNPKKALEKFKFW